MPPSTGPGAAILKVVLDTNVIISALLFEGITSQLVDLWQNGKISLLLSRPVLDEYLRALAYPKFQLTEVEIRALLEDYLLPYANVVPVGTPRGLPSLHDKDDVKFLELASAGKADYLLTGDKEILRLQRIHATLILSPGDFLERFRTT